MTQAQSEQHSESAQLPIFCGNIICMTVPNNNTWLTKAMGMDANGCDVLNAVNFVLFWTMGGMRTTYTDTGRLDHQMGRPKWDREVSGRVVWFA